jgi:hypothetical protein
VAHLRQDPTKTLILYSIHAMSQQHNDLPTSNEAQLQLALQAIKLGAAPSKRYAAAIYNVSRKIVGRQRAGTPLQRNCAANSMKLLKTDKGVVV